VCVSIETLTCVCVSIEALTTREAALRYIRMIHICVSYPHRNEVGLLKREHAVKVEALCVLILQYICVLIPLYMCAHRNKVAVLETEHDVKAMLLTKSLCLYVTN
jgi:hypothetical protein